MCSPSFVRALACSCGIFLGLPMLVIWCDRSTPAGRVELTGFRPRPRRCRLQTALRASPGARANEPSLTSSMTGRRASGNSPGRCFLGPWRTYFPRNRSEVQSGRDLLEHAAPVQFVGTALARRPNELSRDDLRFEGYKPTLLMM